MPVRCIQTLVIRDYLVLHYGVKQVFSDTISKIVTFPRSCCSRKHPCSSHFHVTSYWYLAVCMTAGRWCCFQTWCNDEIFLL